MCEDIVQKVGESTQCKTVIAVVPYTHDDGANYMLILHQAIYITELEVNLICPMQLREKDIEVNDLHRYSRQNSVGYRCSPGRRNEISMKGCTCWHHKMAFPQP